MMFVRTTVILLGRNLFRVSYVSRAVSSPLCNCRRYHPILDDIQALFTKKNEPAPQKLPGSIVPSHSLPSNPSNSSKKVEENDISLDTASSDVQDSGEPSKSPKANSPNLPQVREDVPPVPEAVPQEVTKLKLERKEASSSESLLEQLSHEEITGGALTVGSTKAMTSQSELRALLRDLLQHKEKRTDLLLLHKVSHLTNIVRAEPELAKELWDSGGVHFLNKLTKSRHSEVRRKARLVLAIAGHPPPYPKQGLRILAIDGGGTRALIPITILRHLEKVCNAEVFELFDLVCGTSSGALSANFLCIERGGAVSLERVCRRLGEEVFKTGEITQKVAGLSKLFTKHAFYDSSKYEALLRQYPKSDSLLLDTAAEPGMPKLVFVSTAVNWPALEPFVFRNYYHRPGVTSHYRGTSEAKVWETLRASSAAPGFFEEFKLAQFVHHDGALLTNNPSAVGLHEARLLWGHSVPIQCILSLGTGKYPWVDEEMVKRKNSTPGIVEKLQGILTSVTDSETVHTILKDILPPSVYFRFNPVINRNIPIDECDPKKLDELVHLTEDFIEENKSELYRSLRILQKDKTTWMKVKSKTGEVLDDLQLHLYHKYRL